MLKLVESIRIMIVLIIAMLLLEPGLTGTPLLSTQAIAAPTGERRIALVIGNGAYQHPENLPSLLNPVHDAEDIAKALRGFGFEVIERKNQSLEAMNQIIADFGSRIGGSEAALFYFAGHGIQVKNQNYLMPVDAKIDSEAAVPYKGINVNQILDEMDNGKSGANIVILDACRNNPISGRFRSGKTRGLASPGFAPKGTVIVYATDPGNTAADGDGRNGIFTAGLLTAFKGKDLSLDGVLTVTSEEVERASRKTQTPYINGPKLLQKSFNFRVTVDPGRGEIEKTFWTSIERSSDVADFEAYLRKYPNGSYRELAENQIKRLQAPNKPAVLSVPPLAAPFKRDDPETYFWNDVKVDGSREYFDAYLKKYPKGKYVDLARIELQKLADQKKTEKARENDSNKQAAKQLEARAARIEQESWERAKSGNSKSSYDGYLSRYPEGQFAALAQGAIKKLVQEAAERERQAREEALRQEEQAHNKRKAEERAARIEQESWEQAKLGNSIISYDGYLSRYPEGQFAVLARAARQKFVQETAERERQAREEAVRQEEQARKKREAEVRAARIEQESWERAKFGNSISTYDGYLSRYPEGQFVVLAQGARKKLVQEAAEREHQTREEALRQEEQARNKREVEARAARIEQEIWEQTKSGNSIISYDGYLSRYPEGQFAALAQGARKKLVQEAAERERQVREEAVRQEEQARNKREVEVREARIEQENWEQTKSVNSIISYDGYLSRYPGGQFAAMAQDARKKLVQEAAERERQAREKREAEVLAARIEQESWEQAQSVNSISNYDGYLSRYPEGKFAVLAQAARQKLVQEAEALAARIEQENWGKAQSVNSIISYDGYLSRYPEGKFAVLAQAARQKLVQEAEVQAARIEQESWNLTKSEYNLSVYENFLSRYPKGRFSVEAQENYQILLQQKREEETRMIAVGVEQKDWELAKSENTISAYGNYLNKYPDGRFADLCRVASKKVARDNLVYAAKNIFTLTAVGVIRDSQSGLEWVVGPDENTDYSQAEKWVATCAVAGGGWRMPHMLELKELYAKGVDMQNIQQIFGITGAFVWGEPKDWLSAWNFNFRIGKEQWDTRYDYYNNRVFGVRTRPR